jgi:hypothetical protein
MSYGLPVLFKILSLFLNLDVTWIIDPRNRQCNFHESYTVLLCLMIRYYSLSILLF